jgi:hypothetical protein
VQALKWVVVKTFWPRQAAVAALIGWLFVWCVMGGYVAGAILLGVFLAVELGVIASAIASTIRGRRDRDPTNDDEAIRVHPTQ